MGLPPLPPPKSQSITGTPAALSPAAASAECAQIQTICTEGLAQTARNHARRVGDLYRRRPAGVEAGAIAPVTQRGV